MVNARAKGQRGEREAIAVLQPIVDVVYGPGVLVLERNLTQTRGGGYDIVGLPWLALEVKRQESGSSSQWWRQTIRQAKPGQVPVLMWRGNRQPWRYRTALPVVTGQWQVGPLAMDIDHDEFMRVFFALLHWHKEPRT